MRIFALLTFAVCLISLGCGNAAAPVSVSNQPVSVNGVRQKGVPAKPLPLMSWTGTDGQDMKLKDLEGKVVVMDFWATYCEPCRREIPHLSDLQARYGTDKVRVIGMHVGGDEDRPKIPQFVKEVNLSYPVAYPEDPLISYVFDDTDAIPQTAIFDTKGRMVDKIVGFDESVLSRLDQAVAIGLRQ